jgi:hypothetical protein
MGLFMDDVKECPVCGVRSDDDNLDDFHKFMWGIGDVGERLSGANP